MPHQLEAGVHGASFASDVVQALETQSWRVRSRRRSRFACVRLGAGAAWQPAHCVNGGAIVDVIFRQGAVIFKVMYAPCQAQVW